MRKRWFLVGVIFLLFSLLLVGCGVAQEQYDAVVADLANTQQELQTIQTELGGTKDKVSELTYNLETVNTELEATKAELETSQAKVSNLTSDLEKAQSELEAAKTQNSELNSNLEKSRSELNEIKTENEILEQANNKLERLIFLRTELCSKEPEPWKPIPEIDNTFTTDQNIYVYGEIFGWKYTIKGQKLERDYAISITILDAQGKDAGSHSTIIKDSQDLDKPYCKHGFHQEFTPLNAGNYTAKLEVNDHNSDETITLTKEFEVISS